MNKYVCWEWQRDDGGFCPYPPSKSSALETAWSAGRKQFPLGVYTVDLHNMTQCRVALGTQRMVRRIPVDLSHATIEITAYWTWCEYAGHFIPYQTEASVDIEMAFQQKKKVVNLQVCHSKLPYTINFQNMDQTRHHFLTERDIKRVALPHGTSLQSLLKAVGGPSASAALGGTRYATSPLSHALNPVGASPSPYGVSTSSSFPSKTLPAHPSYPGSSHVSVPPSSGATPVLSHSSSSHLHSGPLGAGYFPVSSTSVVSYTSTTPSHVSANSGYNHINPAVSVPPPYHPHAVSAMSSTGIMSTPYSPHPISSSSFTAAMSLTTVATKPTSSRSASATSTTATTMAMRSKSKGRGRNKGSSAVSSVSSISPVVPSKSGSGAASGKKAVSKKGKGRVTRGRKNVGGASNCELDAYAKKLLRLKPKHDEMCPICMNKLSEASGFEDEEPAAGDAEDPPPLNVYKLKKCGHKLHCACLTMYLKSSSEGGFICPTCKKPYGVKTGDMPNGDMSVTTYSSPLPGHSNCGTIVITYNFRAGTYKGKRYRANGFPRTCYLPDSPKGRKVLELLKVAWERRLTFTIGTSVTTGAVDTVVWNEIHHKTESNSNHSGHGYPDPTYLDRVLLELAAQGVEDGKGEEEDLPSSSDSSSDEEEDAVAKSELVATTRFQAAAVDDDMIVNLSDSESL